MQEFIIVVRSPLKIKKPENLVSLINIGLLTYKGEKFGVEHNFEQFLSHYYQNDMKAFLGDRRELCKAQRIKVLLVGKVHVPKLVCLRDMKIKDLGLRVLPLAVKKSIGNQP